MGMSYLWGVGKSNKDLYLSTTTTTSTLLTKTSDYMDLSGNSVIFGADFAFEDSVNVGMYWRSGFDMTVKEKISRVTNNTVNISSTAEYVREMPYQMGFGVTYNFNDDYNSKLIFDMIYSNWGSSRYWLTKLNGATPAKVKLSPDFINVTEYHVGFEHSPSERMFLRYGFSYLPDYPAVSDAITSVSVGVGIVVQQTVVDFGAEYAFRDENQQRISQIYSGYDNVMERRERLMVTVSYKW